MWLVLGITLSVIGNAMATSLTQDVNLKAATPVLTATPDSITPDGTLYSWADKNGDGVANDPVNAGLVPYRTTTPIKNKLSRRHVA